MPKALTLDRADALAVLVAPPIALISRGLRPVVWVLESSARVLLRPFGVREVIAGDSIRSPEELRALVDEAEGSGVIPRAQEELLHNVFDFASLEARDVMVPVPEVDWLDAALMAEAALAEIVDSRRSRYPVGSGSLDRLVGVVHVQEVVGGRHRRVRRHRGHGDHGGHPGGDRRRDRRRYELPDATHTRLDEQTLLIAGSMTVDDFNEAVGTQLPP